MQYAQADRRQKATDAGVRDGNGSGRKLMRTVALAVLVTALVLAASLASRALWPDLDGAPLAAAWEMWVNGQFVAPTVNGAPVAQPPLFLWSIHAGWALAGVSDWWPRLLPALWMSVTLVPAYLLTRVFWPGEPATARLATMILLGAGGWLVSTTLVAAHMLLTLAVVLGQLALFIAGRHRDGRMWLLLGAALGVGVLGGGPLVLLYLLPPALLAPLWLARKPQPVWSHWYGDLLKALALGATICLLWFVPAYQAAAMPLAAWRALLFLALPVAAVTVDDVAFPLLALAVFLPWIVWPWVWQRVWSMRRVPFSTPVRFALCTLVPMLALLAWLAPAQPLALVPLLPLAAALIAGLAADAGAEADGTLTATMILPLMALGVALAVLPTLPRIDGLPAALWSLSPAIGIVVVLVAIALAWLPLRPLDVRIDHMTLASAVLATLATVVLGWQFNRLHDVTDVAQRVAAAGQAGASIAQVGVHGGEYRFLARLQAPLPVVAPAQAAGWLRDHPQGWLVSDTRIWRPAAQADLPPGGHGTRVWGVTDLTVADFVPPSI